MDRIFDGLLIFMKYYPSAAFSAEHDQVWVYGWPEKKEMSIADEKMLDKLGWFIDEEDGEAWSHFC